MPVRRQPRRPRSRTRAIAGRAGPELRRFFHYGVVGAVATAVHYGILVLAVEAAGWPAYVGSGLGAIVGAQVAYFGNRHFTFAHRGAIAASWPRFQTTAALGALLGMAIVAAGVRVGMYYLVAQMLATVLTMALTFAINRAWSFR